MVEGCVCGWWWSGVQGRDPVYPCGYWCFDQVTETIFICLDGAHLQYIVVGKCLVCTDIIRKTIPLWLPLWLNNDGRWSLMALLWRGNWCYLLLIHSRVTIATYIFIFFIRIKTFHFWAHFYISILNWLVIPFCHCWNCYLDKVTDIRVFWCGSLRE